MDQLAYNADVIERFRTGEPLQGLSRERLLLLTTLGRHSGEPHTAPMMFHAPADGSPIVIASNAGAARHPAWFLNLESEPRVTVELPDETYEATAQPLHGAEYADAWAEITAAYPFFLQHQADAGSRQIPLVRLPRE